MKTVLFVWLILFIVAVCGVIALVISDHNWWAVLVAVLALLCLTNIETISNAIANQKGVE